MNLACSWNHHMEFTASTGGHHVLMDAKKPIGHDRALTPKQLLLAAVCGCTGMDIVALLKKYQQPLESLEIQANAQSVENSYPAVFQEIQLWFQVKGPVDPAQVLKAVTLSQTKYCGVSAMLVKAVPISYRVDCNGQQIGTGYAKFDA